MTLLAQLLLNALANAAVFSLLAVGFGLIYRSLRFFNIAYGAVYVAASYTVVALAQLSEIPLFFLLISGIILAMLLSILMDRTVYIPLERSGATSGVLLVASLGIYILIVNVIALFFGNEVKTISSGIEPSFPVGPLVVTRMQIIQAMTGWFAVTVFWLGIRRNTFIKAIWAMGETPELVIALGLPYNLMRTVVFSLSALFAASASLLTSLDVGTDPHVGMGALLTGAVAVIVGGVDVFKGWIGGATLLALLQGVAVWQFSSKWTDVITFGMLITTLLFRPQGLFSPKRRREER